MVFTSTIIQYSNNERERHLESKQANSWKGFVVSLKKMINIVLIAQTDSPEIKGGSQKRQKTYISGDRSTDEGGET